MYKHLFKKIQQPINRKEQMYGRCPSDILSLPSVVTGSVIMCIVILIINIGKKLFCLGTSKRRPHSSLNRYDLYKR